MRASPAADYSTAVSTGSLLRRVRARFSLRDDLSKASKAPAFIAAGLTVGLCLAIGALLVLGYVATRQWQRETDILTENRAAASATLAKAAIEHDLGGMWRTVLASFGNLSFSHEPTYDMFHMAAQAFARFPYPGSLVFWGQGSEPSAVAYAFSRSERPEHWGGQPVRFEGFPSLVLVKDPPELSPVIATVRAAGRAGNNFVLRELTIDGVPHQIVAHLLFTPASPRSVTTFAAIVVDMSWVRQHYFGPLLTEIAKIVDADSTLSLAVHDDSGALVAQFGSPSASVRFADRRFPLLFLDSALASATAADGPSIEYWSIVAGQAPDSGRLTALVTARSTFLAMSLSAVITLTALVLTIRTVQASAEIASLKSEFISNVTHELKTPVALMRLVGETLSRRRDLQPEVVADYARILSEKASDLSKSIDDLLIYAKYSSVPSDKNIDVTSIKIADLVEDALEPFRPKLEQIGATVTIDIPDDLPHTIANRSAMITALQNVIDNAVKYSTDRHVLNIAARARGRQVELVVGDCGSGISAPDLLHVFDRFYRGTNARASGSGLGLAIAKCIVSYHRGQISIDSTTGVGTQVRLTLPAERV